MELAIIKKRIKGVEKIGLFHRKKSKIGIKNMPQPILTLKDKNLIRPM